MTYRIVIVDDHKVVREGLRAILEQEPDFEIVGEAGSGEQGSWLIARQKPDVALVDIRLDEVNGLDICRYAAGISPDTKVLILTAFMDSNLIHQALQAGAKGYLLKDAEQMDLVARVRQVLAGQMAFDPRVTSSLKDYVRNVMTKLEARNRVDAVTRAVRRGLI